MTTNTIQIKESGTYEFHVKEETLHLNIGKRVDAKVFLTYDDGKEKESVYHIEEGANAMIFVRYETAMDYKENLHLQLDKDAQLKFACYVMNEQPCRIDVKAELKGSGADLQFHSAVLATKQQHFNVEIKHLAPYTTGVMENYAVVKEHADYKMKACGTIVKGMHDSNSHQTTRVLTLSQNQKSEVTPLLLIDENNVSASHATTLGQPDANQLYYLQTRGLNQTQALGLLTIGYFYPILDFVFDEQKKEELQKEIEMKVGLYV